MILFSFGQYIEKKSFKVLDERVMRGSAALMFLIGIITFVFGFVIKNYAVLPYFSGFLMLNFLIGVVINPQLSPTVIISKLLTRKQKPLWVGAIQKHFAWSLGLALSSVIFILSILLQNDVSLFQTICLLCITCLTLLFLEMGFGICIGCKLYFLFRKIGWIKQPKENPNCAGDACEIS